MSRDDMFSRWTDRKRRVAEEERVDEETPADAPALDIAEPETPEEEAALLERLGLPRPEDVTPGEDAAKFLQAHVPEFLRRRALRTLWRSDPTFAVLDGLNDYDDDFRSPELNQKVLATAYEVGKGILKKVEIAVTEPDERTDEEEVEVLQEPLEDEQVSQGETDFVTPVSDDKSEPGFAPRRMTFET